MRGPKKRYQNGAERQKAYRERKKTLPFMAQSINGFVYFLQLVPQGYIKIGFSGDPISRRKQLQVGIEGDLVPLVAVPGSLYLERQLHQVFSFASIGGEWFMPLPDLIDHIERLDRMQLLFDEGTPYANGPQ